MVLHREKEIFATEQEMTALYQLLTKVPDNLPFEHLLSNAGDLYLQYPPTELANEAIRRFTRYGELENGPLKCFFFFLSCPPSYPPTFLSFVFFCTVQLI